MAKMILLNKGFEIGKNYNIRGDLLPSMPIAWKLISIDGDGTSKLQTYSSIGVLGDNYLTVTGEELSRDFAIVEKNSRCAAIILRMRQSTMLR